jgi:methionyl-tRNA synthetase
LSRYYITTAIPYVNGQPHIGHALELIETDVLARYHRQKADRVRFQSGTDDNALKNVQSAEAAGIPTQDYVNQVSSVFAALRDPLGLSFDDFVKTSSDPRHQPGVEKLWLASAARGDFYQKDYEGLYCIGCERFYTADELAEGRCPEHGTVPELVHENNWFFRLSSYQEKLAKLIASDELRVEPAFRKREVLSFIESGLEDFSVSRSVARARGWGIPVPEDPDQVIYVWYDALANYITGPGYGTNAEGFKYWWTDSDARVHVIGKGILRFHAVYWPAMLMSAGLALPTTIYVHEYLTADGRKIGKSAGNAEDLFALVPRFGQDAVRWWFLRDVALRGDTDYSHERLVLRANEDLANNIGNLVNRTVSMVGRYRNRVITAPAFHDDQATELRTARQSARGTIQVALEAFDFRRAAEAIVTISDEGNRYVEAARPWELAKAERGGAAPDALDAVLGELIVTCQELAEYLRPFLPAAAERIAAQCGGGGSHVLPPSPVFPRLEVDSSSTA